MLFSNLYVLGTTPVSLIMDLFRQLFFFFDSMIYALIPLVYNMIFALYDLSTLFGDASKLSEIVKNMSATVYSFLAIVMFFRTAVSLLTMLIDPNKIDDKDQGIKKIVVNIFLCLALIVVVPKAFEIAKKVQAKVMEEHIIEKTVIGENFNSNSKDYNLGDEFAFQTWGIFLAPVDDDNAVNKAYCSVFPDSSEKCGRSDFRVETAFSDLGRQLNSTNSIIGGAIKIPGVSDLVNDVTVQLTGKYTHYHLSYMWLLSTIAGIYVLWTFIKLMIDIAYRSIKFFVLELLSPIAIISYIDPNSSKKGLFSKWLKETMSTYLSLFVRVFVFAMVTLLLSSFSLSDIGTGNGLAVKTGNTVFVKLFYMIALLAFLKNAPKLLDELFGTTISKGSDTKVGRELVGGLIGAGAVGAVGGISGAVAAKAAGRSAAVGAITGAWSSGKKGFDTGKKSMIGIIPTGMQAAQDQYKKYGLDHDLRRDLLINNLEGRVEGIDKAKARRIEELEANNGAKYKELLARGANYNKRKYGKGLEGDDKLYNTIKKNLGGLTRDEMLHGDDAEYLRLRRLVYDQKNGEALVTRTLELAKDDFERNTNAYQNSGNKAQYIVDFAQETNRMNMDTFNGATRDQKIAMVVKATGIDKDTVSEMDDATLLNTYQVNMQTEYRNLVAQAPNMSEAQLDARFTKETAARIEATYGHSFGDIAADATKAQGDAKATQEGLDQYIKTKGSKIKEIDAAYAVADTRNKAKVKERERQQQQQQQQNNNNNNNNNNNGTNP